MTALFADHPSSNPQDDLFGHAPFAESLANSICRYPGNDGLVLALYGPSGSQKSTVRLPPRLNPAWLERYIDTGACALRLIDLRQTGGVPDIAREAVDQFLKEFEMLKSGQSPDGAGAFDD